MRIHVLSDLHFEFFNKDWGSDFFEQLEKLNKRDPAELLILAGDICVVSRHEVFFKSYLARMASYYKQVILIAGNHEAYATSLPRVDEYLKSFDLEPNLHNVKVLQDGEFFTWNNQEFYAGTMWFPDEHYENWVKRGMSDFFVIKGFEPEVYLRHEKFMKNLDKVTKDTMVITHHLPTPEAIAPQFEGSQLNPFFCYDIRPYLKEVPRLWVCGHTHLPLDFISANGMRVYCNPFAYPDEGTNPQFWMRCGIDI